MPEHKPGTIKWYFILVDSGPRLDKSLKVLGSLDFLKNSGLSLLFCLDYVLCNWWLENLVEIKQEKSGALLHQHDKRQI